MFDTLMILGLSIQSIGLLGLIAAVIVFGVFYWLHDEVEWSLMARFHVSQSFVKRSYFGIASTCALLVALTAGLHNAKSNLESKVSDCVWEKKSCELDKRLHTRLGGEIPDYRILKDDF